MKNLDGKLSLTYDEMQGLKAECKALRAERLYLRAAIQAIACRLAGEFDHPALMAYGPLRGSDHDIAAIARIALEKVPA